LSHPNCSHKFQQIIIYVQLNYAEIPSGGGERGEGIAELHGSHTERTGKARDLKHIAICVD
jgi:hypothetical protein